MSMRRRYKDTSNYPREPDNPHDPFERFRFPGFSYKSDATWTPGHIIDLVNAMETWVPDNDSNIPRSPLTKSPWNTKLHKEACLRLQQAVNAGQMGMAMAEVWNIASGLARLYGDHQHMAGSLRAYRSVKEGREKATSRAWGGVAADNCDTVREEVIRRLKHREAWDVIIIDLMQRFKKGRATISKVWLKGLNPNKPGPRKRNQ